MRRASALLLVGVVVAGACTGGGDTGSDGGPVASAPDVDVDETFDGASEADAVAATWSLVDQVPSHRKPGVLVRIGLDAQSQTDTEGAETLTRLVVHERSAMFAISPARGAAVPFDAIEMAAQAAGPIGLWPFVLGTDGRMVRFAADDEIEACRSLDAEASAVALEFDERLGGRFEITEVECREAVDAGSSTRGVLGDHGPVALFGVWLQSDSVDTDVNVDATVDVDRLALVDTTEPLSLDEPLRINVVGLETTVASRTPDLADDAGIEFVTVLDANGARDSFPIVDGVAEMATDDFTGPVWISIDDLGLFHHPLQGAWIDVDVSTRSIVIDATPEFTPTEEPPGPSNRASGAHVLADWFGSGRMARQEYEGLTFRNNLGIADRDRAEESDCRRAAYLGGSFAEALQTRVDQKPGIIAEALLGAEGHGCVEVFTYGGDRFTVENHLGNARTLVEDFGVEVLIFSVSGLEVCRMDDLVYANAEGVDPTTPTRWRLVDGAVIEPLSRRAALDFDASEEFEVTDRCDLSSAALDGEDDVENAVVAKLADLKRVIEGFGPGVVVRFTNVKDAVVGLEGNAAGLEQRCADFELDCSPLKIPHPLVATVPVSDATDFLYRYQFDAHPNVRANQLIGAHLAALIEDALLISATG